MKQYINKNRFTNRTRFINKDRLLNMRERMQSLLPNKRDDHERRQFKSVLWGIIGVFGFAILLGSMGLLLTLTGSEVIMVPDLEGLMLIDAMEKLQDHSLITHIQKRFFEEPAGTVINQRPDAGSQVRVGRTINLVVSQGPVVDQVGDYVGMSLADLRRQLIAQFATHDPLFEVKEENISYVFSEEPEQTILAQEPMPGQKLASYTDLMLLVSRGKKITGITAPEVIGLDYLQAVGMLAVRNIPFVFYVNDIVGGTVVAGLVVGQQPAVGEQVNGPLELFINPIKTEGTNQAAGIFAGTLPETALPATVVVEFVNSIGEKQPYFQTTRLGGAFSFPYLYEAGSKMQISINGEVIPQSVLQDPEKNSDKELYETSSP